MIQLPFQDRLIEARQVHLRVLATSDLHMHIMPFDYARNRASVAVGLARTAGLVAAARSAARNVVLLDNGDFLQGSPMAELAAVEPGPNPAITAMNVLGYDAATLGNHEFNYGLDVLNGALESARFPVVSANAAVRPGHSPRADRMLLAPWTILRREVFDLAGRPVELRLGVIGLVPPQVAVWDRDHVAGRVWFRDMVQAAAARVPELREAGADLVVALAHTGIGGAAAVDGMENAAVPLARVPGIDVLVAGHAHLVFPAPGFAGMAGVDAAAGLIEGKPAVMPGAFGSHLGIVDILAEPGPKGWRVAASSVAAQPIMRRGGGGRRAPRVAPAAEVMQAVAGAHARTRAWVARHAGKTAVRLCTHFGLVADTAAFRLVAAAQAAHVAERLRGGAFAGLPVLGSAAPFKAGGRGGPAAYLDVPPGPVTMRHLAELYPFPNAVRALRLSGAGLRRWLEQSAAVFRQVGEAAVDAPLLGPEAPGYAFDLIAGLDFDICPGRPAGQRIRRLRIDGREVSPEDSFIVATNSYRAAASAPDAEVVLSEPLLVRDVVAAHLQACGTWRPPAARGWRLCLPRAASVTLDTAPGARPADLDRVFGAVESLGLTGEGFRRFRLQTVAG